MWTQYNLRWKQFCCFLSCSCSVLKQQTPQCLLSSGDDATIRFMRCSCCFSHHGCTSLCSDVENITFYFDITLNVNLLMRHSLVSFCVQLCLFPLTHLCSFRSSPVSSEDLLLSCGFLLCKGLVSPMDLVSVHLSSSPRLFSFLSLAWGFVADVDVESEKYRHVGAARFTVGTLVRLASLRVYKGKLSYLPATKDYSSHGGLKNNKTLHCNNQASSKSPVSLLRRQFRESPCQNTLRNSCHSNNSLKVRRTESTPSRSATKALPGPSDSLLLPLEQPLPSDWVVVQEEDFVLMLAMYQSHLAEDLLAAPDATLDDGVIHLFFVKAGISRTALLRLFLAMEKGTHLATNCQHLVYTKVRALRLEPYSPKGIITVDGEVVEYGPVQAEVHRSLARLITG